LAVFGSIQLVLLLLSAIPGDVQAPVKKPPADVQEAPRPSNPDDPFADLKDSPKPVEKQEARSGWAKFLGENFGFRKEVMLQSSVDETGNASGRESAGFEVLKKFSTETATVASFDFQGRLVRRDRFVPVLNDMEGMSRAGWAFEYHNLYLDLYNILNPLLSDERRGHAAGRFNFRVGRFYVPFGLNLQTDTHGTVLQLSNERNFGFERDWYAGFWGSLNKHLNYDLNYLTGSGYGLKFKGQSGLGALRISLANQYSSRFGLEGGVSVIGGERLSNGMVLETKRAGLDGRYRRAVPTGLLTFTSELSGGRDARLSVYSQLHQGEYLHRSRRWGLATQYRWLHEESFGAEASLIGEATWYFRNDAGNSNLHWIKLNVERPLERMQGPQQQRPHTVVTLQYYFYR
jgi:hypothetical protein